MAAYDLEKILSNPSINIYGKEQEITKGLLKALGDNEEEVPGLAIEW